MFKRMASSDCHQHEAVDHNTRIRNSARWTPRGLYTAELVIVSYEETQDSQPSCAAIKTEHKLRITPR